MPRKVVKEIPNNSDASSLAAGRILKRIGDRFLVHHDRHELVCAVRKTVAKSELAPAVGDRVRFARIDEASGVIEEVLERRTSMVRTAAGPKPVAQVLLANLDLLVVVASYAEPDPNQRLIDRFLVMAEFSDIPSVIVWNKVDLMTLTPPMPPPTTLGGEIAVTPPYSPPTVAEGEREDTRGVAPFPPYDSRGGQKGGNQLETSGDIPLFERYRRIGYPGIRTCALTGQGVEALRNAIFGKTSMFIGASGVGKTSLLNQLSPHLGRRVAEISRATGKGKHVTSATEIVPLDAGTFIADSPGVREFAMWGVTRLELGNCFREFRPFIEQCRFRNCLHDQEVGCGVKQAVDRADIDPERWDSYLRILRSM